MEHYDPKDKNQHFFATTVAGWGTASDPLSAVRRARQEAGLKKGQRAWTMIIHVPLPEDAYYKINFFVPQVEGATKIYEGEI